MKAIYYFLNRHHLVNFPVFRQIKIIRFNL